MPTVAIVEGAKIQFFPLEHPPPHFHVAFAEYRAQIGIAPLRLLKGSLPPAKLAVVLTWAELRQEALMNTWYTVLARQKPEKIR
jgi:uncharacterized protein DUF4160